MELTFDKEHYASSIKSDMELILSSDLLNVNPYDMSDGAVLDFLKKRSNYSCFSDWDINRIEEFCSIVKVDSIQENEYNCIKFNQVVLKNEKDFHLRINCSSFRCDLYPLKECVVNPNRYFCVDFPTACTVDREFKVPNVGTELIYMYSFSSVSKRWRKERLCYRFCTLSSNIDLVRNCILEIQWFILSRFVKYTKALTMPAVLFCRGSRKGVYVTDSVGEFF